MREHRRAIERRWEWMAAQAIIYGEVMPHSGEGGETHFCDMYGAYERLTPAA